MLHHKKILKVSKWASMRKLPPKKRLEIQDVELKSKVVKLKVKKQK